MKREYITKVMMLDAMWRPCEQEERIITKVMMLDPMRKPRKQEERIHNKGDDARSYVEAMRTN